MVDAKTVLDMESLVRRATLIMLVYGNVESEQSVRAGMGRDMQDILADALLLYAEKLANGMRDSNSETSPSRDENR
jgi:hypothetical protein